VNSIFQSGGAIFFDSVEDVSISDSAFVGNTAGLLSDSGGGGGAITSFLGRLSLTTTVFRGNAGFHGSDILVEDDTDPEFVGSFISCNAKVIFCDGISGFEELSYEDDEHSNSNCPTWGIPGEQEEEACTVQVN
jgi:hypothetical protein